MDLKMINFNCCSLKKNIDLIRKLTDEAFDIIFLEETLLLEDRQGDLAFIDERYESVGVGAYYSEKALTANAGRAEGGLACLWKKDAAFKVTKIFMEEKYLGIEVTFGNRKALIVNVYIRSDIWEARTLDAYLNYLSELEHLFSSTDFNSLYILGDFNADPYSGRAWNNLSEFMSRNSLRCFDVQMLEPSTFTYISYGNSYCKWLDHVIGRDADGIKVTSTRVLYNFIGSDHLPMETILNFQNCDDSLESHSVNVGKRPLQLMVDWDKLTLPEIDIIEKEALNIMGNFVSSETVCCTKIGCHNSKHLDELNSLFELMIDSVHVASNKFAREKHSANKFKVIPGWNRNVKHLHSVARGHYLVWITTGRLRESEEFFNMNESRKLFKKALNDCKVNELREVSLSVEEKYRDKDMKTFWKEIKSMSNKVKFSKLIDGETDVRNIIDIFNKKFLIEENIQNHEIEESSLLAKIRTEWVNGRKMYLKISSHTLKKYIQRLKVGVGHDGIHSTFLKHASDRFLDNVAHLVNACFSHVCIITDLLKGTINPTIKDLKGNCAESGNYRPVMQSSCLLKIIEMHLLSILEEKITFNMRQFGFEKATSTTDACFVLKEVIHKYTKKKGKVFSAFIDLSKAFDRVDHFILGNMLLERNVPVDVVMILMNYLRNQSAKIVWDGESGDYFAIDKGVRQGGILSPFLFKLYIDGIIKSIDEMNIGCKLGHVRINILAYADDLVLISDTQEHLEKMYIKLLGNIEELKLLVNRNKSKCVIFENSRFGNQIAELRLGNDVLENVNNYRYLGHVIERNLNDAKDIEYRLNQFYARFNSTYRKFKKVSIETFMYLFNAYCLPDYGLALWNSEFFNQNIFNVFEIAFHRALKKIVGAPNMSSNHDVAEYCNQLLFKHYVTFLQCRYFKRISKSSNRMVKICSPFLKEGYLRNSLFKILNRNYNIDFNANDLDIIQARISWIQRHEVRTGVHWQF